MAGDEGHFLAGHLVRDGDGLAGVAGVVADVEHELLAHDAAGLVDIGDGLFGAGLHLGAGGGVVAGHGTDGGNLDLRISGTRGERNGRGGKECSA